MKTSDGANGYGANGTGASGARATAMTPLTGAPRRGFRARGLAWPVGITAILGVTVAGNLWVARIAGSDPSVQVEPDYYRKAVEWDARVAQERRNAALGWTLEPTVAAEHGVSRLAVRLTDRAGAPLAGATVTVSAFPVARSADVVTARLVADGDGYAARVPVARTGIWELRFDVVRGAERFTSTRRVELAAAAPAPRT